MQFALKNAAQGGGDCPDGQKAVQPRRGRKLTRAGKAKREAAAKRKAEKAQPNAAAKAKAKVNKGSDAADVAEPTPVAPGKKRKTPKQGDAEPPRKVLKGEAGSEGVGIAQTAKSKPKAKAKAKQAKC